jgi:hypothetical protein
VAGHYPVDLENQSLGEHRYDDEPRPQTFAAWLFWLALWPIVAVAWLVAVPFVLIYLIYVSVGVMIEVLFGSPL